MRFLDECILLFVHANPDGNELVADWYMRNPDPLKRSAAGLPRLYQHTSATTTTATSRLDSSRDRVHQSRPLPRVAAQILYNHHQSGWDRGVVFAAAGPLQLQPRSAADSWPAGTRHAHAPTVGCRREAWRHDGVRRRVRRLVERRDPQHRQFPQHHRHPDRDDWQPDADADPPRHRAADPESQSPYPIAPQEWRFKQSVNYQSRSIGRSSTTRRATASTCSTTSTRWGDSHRARRPGYLDALADAAADGRREDGWWRRPRRHTRAGRRALSCCGSRSTAIRAATSSREPNPISSRRSSSSTRCVR